MNIFEIFEAKKRASRGTAKINESIGPDKNDPWEQGWRARPGYDFNPYKKDTSEYQQWEAGQAEREAQPNHYDEGVAEATGNGQFDSMMKKVTRAPTAKDRNAERIRQKRERQADSRNRATDVFGTSPADELSIRKSPDVAEGAEETLQQQKIRAAISNGLAKSSQMGKTEYQSQPTNRTYFDNAGYASDKLTGIDSIDPDGTVVISMGDTKAANWVKKLATLGGMPGVKTREVQPQKQGVTEGKGLAKKVKIVQGPDAGKTGWIREIKHGAFKGAAKSYYIDLDDGGQANNVPGTALRLVKDPAVAEGKLVESAVFLNPTTVVVGQAHGRSLELSPDTLKKIQAIAAKHGAWYEGNGTDRSYTKGQIDRYVGSWDDEVAKTASPNDPKWLYVLFANVDENNRVQRVGVDPQDTIFNRLLTTAKDNSFQGIGFTSQALQKFLSMASEGKYDFVKMSQQPATQENLTRFLKAGEALMWPGNWEQYPNRAGKIAKSATVDVRDQYLATRKAGVYVTGSGHLKAVQNITGKQGVAEDSFNQNFNQIDSIITKKYPKEIMNLLLGMFPTAKEAIVNQYNDEDGMPFSEWRRAIWDIGNYVLSGPVVIDGSKLPIDSETEADRLAKYQQYIKDKDSGKPARYFRNNDSDPRTIDFTKLPPITIAQTNAGMTVTDGNHRAFLAKMANKPLRAYVLKQQPNNHPNVAKIKALFSNQQSLAEGYAGVDDTDTVGFSVNTEKAYTAVMRRFGDVIDHDETSGIMYAPARVWPQIEIVAFDADGEGATRDDGIDENLRNWFGKEKWVRMDTKGNIKGDCARGSEKEGKPKCLPQAKAHALGKKGRAAATQKKRREDPNPERRGAAINVDTKVREQDTLDEACWTGYHKEGMKTMFGKKYPNCVKNKNESLETYIKRNECPGCGGVMVAEGQLTEKQDACYHKVKSRYKVWPSAYASGALVRCRKVGADSWGSKSESATEAVNPAQQAAIAIAKKKKMDVAEAERNEMDTPAVQAALARMAARHNKEQWTKEQLAALGKRLAASKQNDVEEDQWHGENDAWSDGKGQWSDGRGQWDESTDADVANYLAEMKNAGYDIK